MMRWLLAVLLGAAAVHFAAVFATPTLIMRGAMARLGQVPNNTFAHPPLATAATRGIVRPSPDLAYSSLVFDVSERPLEVRVPVTAPYTSVSGFASNTDNFFAWNDRNAGAADGDIRVMLTGPSWRAGQRDAAGDAAIVESPSDRGILLVRRVVPSAAAFPEIDALRRRATAAR